MILALGRMTAQDCDPYFIIEKGAVREMASYDKKDKLTGTTVQTVKEVKTDGAKTEWTIGTVSKDEKGKDVSSGDLKMSCEAGIFKMDMKNFVDQATLQSYEGMDVTIDATDLDFPSSLTAGQTLKDGSISIKVLSSGMTVMNMVIKVYDRKVQGVEDITTPAGTFSCYKITSTIETKNMFTIVAKSTDWMAKKIGTVKSESYDKDGKLMGYTVLTSMKQ
jgi:hypothetical protein